MNIEKYTTQQISENEFQFFSEGNSGKFEMRIQFSEIDAERSIYNLGFGIWNPLLRQLDDQTEVRNGDTDNILATVGQHALEFLIKNPEANLMATGTILKGQLALRTRKYQMGINSNLEFLSEKHNIYGFVAEKVNGKIVGRWPYMKGSWEIFKSGTNYDAFLLNLK